jgi:hypothetical protein
MKLLTAHGVATKSKSACRRKDLDLSLYAPSDKWCSFIGTIATCPCHCHLESLRNSQNLEDLGQLHSWKKLCTLCLEHINNYEDYKSRT